MLRWFFRFPEFPEFLFHFGKTKLILTGTSSRVWFSLFFFLHICPRTTRSLCLPSKVHCSDKLEIKTHNYNKTSQSHYDEITEGHYKQPLLNATWLGVSHLWQAKLLDRNQIQGLVAVQNQRYKEYQSLTDLLPLARSIAKDYNSWIYFPIKFYFIHSGSKYFMIRLRNNSNNIKIMVIPGIFHMFDLFL